MAIVRTLCGQCSVGCGIRAVTEEGREVTIAGDPVHPVNSGLLCPKSGALADMIPLDARQLDPMIHGRPVKWDKAVAHIARRLGDILSHHGPDSVAMHLSGRMLTEDYYVANKLMKGFIGSANISGARARDEAVASAHRAAFGEDIVPGAYEDIEQADAILLVGTAIERRHPVLFDRVRTAQEERGVRLILLASDDDGNNAGADFRVQVNGGTEGALLRGLLLHWHDTGALDRDFFSRHVETPGGFWEGLRPSHDLWSVARRCRVEPGEVRAFYDALTPASRVVTLHAADHHDGDDGLPAAILNLHLARGWIGKGGATPMILSAAPNGMGAREVGCDHEELAAHTGFSEASRASVARFWGARNLVREPGLRLEALSEAILSGRIKALWLLGGLPPAGHPLLPVIEHVRLLILSTPWTEPDMRKMVVLPSPAWVEKDGTMTGADRLISRQRHLFSLPGSARPDWWALTEVGRAMGWGDAFHYERPAEIYREHVRLTAYQNEGERLLNLRRHAPISNPAYEELTPWRWGEAPFDGGRFPTPDGRARLIPL